MKAYVVNKDKMVPMLLKKGFKVEKEYPDQTVMFKESLDTDFPPLYHGTSSEELVRTYNFKPKDIYLTDDYDNAIGFAMGKHFGGAHGKNKYVLTVMAKTGKIYDGNSDVQQIIMEEHEDFREMEDLMDWARSNNYSYVTFYHPSFESDKEIFVVVSLYPNRDLKIVDMDRL